MVVASERCIEYVTLSTGCKARRAFLIILGVTARFTVRPGCMTRRTLRGTSNLEKKPTLTSRSAKPYAAKDYPSASAHVWIVCGLATPNLPDLPSTGVSGQLHTRQAHQATRPALVMLRP
jgi:hypothetical protein